MLVGDLLDTVMNLVAFAFLGAMAWLLVRPLPKHDDTPDNTDDKPK